MYRFARGDAQVLLSTAIIENGLDIPNVNTIIINDAWRFGLSQLYQLRGRVGRGSEQSYCVAFHSSSTPSERLEAFASKSDGFRLAEEDLRIRGQGDMFGKEQHGVTLLRFADLTQDRDLLEDASHRAMLIVGDDPTLSKKVHSRLRKELDSRYATREALYQVG